MPDIPDKDEAAPQIAQGAYGEAAALLRRRGDLQRAQELYERIWDFKSAAEVARERGDRPALLRLLIDARDPYEVRLLHTQLLHGATEEQELAAAIYEGRRMWAEAAQLREALGQPRRARDAYQQARLPLEVARVSELLGEHREAGMAYERLLGSVDPAAPVEDGLPGDRLRAHLGLARVLRHFAQHEEAIRQLQRARRLIVGISAFADVLEDIDRHLIAALHALGHDGVAMQVLLRWHGRKKDHASLPPPTLDAFLRAQEVKEALQHGQGAQAAPGGATDTPPLRGRYAIVRLLGSGGMGRVYLAHDRLHVERVAVKMVPPPPPEALPDAGRGHESYRRFAREARVVSALHHQSIVRVLEFHEEDGLLVMEYLPGGTLADRPLPLPYALCRAVLLSVTDGLQAAHGCGIVHRDIKPQNIFFTATSQAKLGDFGVAHLQDLGATQTAGFVGTLAYMSPEQISGAPLTFATDIYALGVTAFQMLTGRLPFTGPDFIGQHLGEAPPRPSEVTPGVPPAWDEICARALGKHPGDRFGSLEELRHALLALPADDPVLPLPGDDRGAGEAALKGTARADRAQEEAPPSHYRADAVISAGVDGRATLLLGTDTRLGRQVLIERFPRGLLQGEVGAAHLRWLQVMARHGGPGLQRILRIEMSREGDEAAPGAAGRGSIDDAQVIYEAPVGQPVLAAPGEGGPRRLTGRELLRLGQVLHRLHDDGVVHGSVLTAVVREESLPLIMVSGRGPLTWTGTATAEQDLHALGRLAGDAHATERAGAVSPP